MIDRSIGIRQRTPPNLRSGSRSAAAFGSRGTVSCLQYHRGTSLIRNSLPLGPYGRTMPRALWWPYWGVTVSDERGSSARVASGSPGMRVVHLWRDKWTTLSGSLSSESTQSSAMV